MVDERMEAMNPYDSEQWPGGPGGIEALNECFSPRKKCHMILTIHGFSYKNIMCMAKEHNSPKQVLNNVYKMKYFFKFSFFI